MKQYIKQCIANCDVCPINCPDSTCKLKGSLSKSEVKYLILTSTSHLVLETTDNNNNNTKNESTMTNDKNNKPCYVDYETVINMNENNDKEALLSNSIQYNQQIDDESDECKKTRLNLYKQYLNMYKNNEILRDPTKVHCSRPNCQNVCTIKLENKGKQKFDYFNKSKVTCDKVNFNLIPFI